MIIACGNIRSHNVSKGLARNSAVLYISRYFKLLANYMKNIPGIDNKQINNQKSVC